MPSGVMIHGGSFTHVAGDIHVLAEVQKGSGSNTKRKRTKDDHCDELRVGYCIHFTAMFYVNITLWLSHQHVKRRYLELHTELVRGSSYRLHSGRQGGKAIIIQSF
ncbi:hypothetical protein L208DRAFT_338693 [Tricholoma matsutake]|nr:hypothetical protein L208DRAFT_338693 [Tricholoma matsutake 945]